MRFSCRDRYVQKVPTMRWHFQIAVWRVYDCQVTEVALGLAVQVLYASFKLVVFPRMIYKRIQSHTSHAPIPIQVIERDSTVWNIQCDISNKNSAAYACNIHIP